MELGTDAWVGFFAVISGVGRATECILGHCKTVYLDFSAIERHGFTSPFPGLEHMVGYMHRSVGGQGPFLYGGSDKKRRKKKKEGGE